MSLNTVTTGNTILASDINALVNVLQRASGQNEVGSYALHGWGNAAGDYIGTWVPSLSRTSVPVSVSIDGSIIGPFNLAAASTANLNANGFHVYSTSAGAGVECKEAGNYTISY